MDGCDVRIVSDEMAQNYVEDDKGAVVCFSVYQCGARQLNRSDGRSRMCNGIISVRERITGREARTLTGVFKKRWKPQDEKLVGLAGWMRSVDGISRCPICIRKRCDYRR